MELDNLKEFIVICDHEDILLEAIRIYNQTYKTDFELKEMIHDEVNFAKITGYKLKASDIFSLGSMYGRISQENRN